MAPTIIYIRKNPKSVHKKEFDFNYALYMCRISAFDPPPARVFSLRVLELKEQGAGEEEAMSVADVCFFVLPFC